MCLDVRFDIMVLTFIAESYNSVTQLLNSGLELIRNQ